MKKFLIAVFALSLGITNINAQTTKTSTSAKPAVQQPSKVAPVKSTAPKKETAPAKATKPAQATAPTKAEKPAKSKLPTVSPVAKTKKDGTPDRRYKENQKLKKDGTPDKRYKENKAPAQKSSKPAVKQDKAATKK
jgi:hypothetical protein